MPRNIGDWYLIGTHNLKEDVTITLELNNVSRTRARYILALLRQNIVNYDFEKEPYKT